MCVVVTEATQQTTADRRRTIVRLVQDATWRLTAGDDTVVFVRCATEQDRRSNCQLVEVVGEKCPPALVKVRAGCWQVPRHRAFRDGHSDVQQLAVDSRLY